MIDKMYSVTIFGDEGYPFKEPAFIKEIIQEYFNYDFESEEFAESGLTEEKIESFIEILEDLEVEDKEVLHNCKSGKIKVVVLSEKEVEEDDYSEDDWSDY